MKENETLSEARRLYALGFAIIWIRPKSKVPVKSGWTTGERTPWAELEKTYRPGFNVGVRTGTPSQMKLGGYLACIDVDVKDPAYRKEAVAKLKEIVGGQILPEVRSGGGNGSRHLYCVTEKPFKMITVAKEKGKWEIALYSDGRQMVLPPSIHPSGRNYEWKTNFSRHNLSTFDFSFWAEEEEEPNKKNTVIKDDAASFKLIENVDLKNVPPSIRKLISKGIWNGEEITDRSAHLLTAATSLASHGLSSDEIVTVLTNPNTFLGQCAYDHAQTTSREKAARWLYNYTVKRAVQERAPHGVFEPVTGKEPRPLSFDAGETAAQAGELVGTPEERGYYMKGARGGLSPDYPALLERFTEEQAFKTIADMKTVYVFNGTHYEDFTPIEIKAFAETHFNPKPEEKLRAEFLSKVLANNVERRSFFVDSIESKLNFTNGVLDLSDGSELKEHSPDFGFRGVIPYDYDPKAKCPRFKEWLDGIMMGDVELQSILQEYMGYIIRGGEYKYHKALWLGGAGRNGKSTFVDLLKALIGPGNYSTTSIRSLMNDKFAGADLDGKIANFSEETSPQELADSGPFKNLTGDGELSVQKKFGDPYSFRNRAKLVMTYNEIPNLKDLTKGMLSRPLIIPFSKVIEDADQDRTIKYKLFEELPGIFNFALRGWKRLEKQNGFTRSEASEMALRKVEAESCNVYQWIENYVEFNPGQSEPSRDESERFRPADLYVSYCGREKYPFHIVKFYRRLHTHPGMKKHFWKSKKGAFFFGLKLR